MTPTQKQTGLLFQPDMALANVADLKSMTRRGNGLAKLNQNANAYRFDGWISNTTGDKADIGKAYWSPIGNGIHDGTGSIKIRCPWQVGQLIYQKERWRVGSQDRNTIWYGDGTFKLLSDTADNLAGKFLGNKNKSPLFMYPWAARFWAEIVSIKVERVRDISAEDCLKEGLSTTLREHDAVVRLRDDYRDLYNRINGPGAFDHDWCWVIEYRRVER